MYYKRDLESVGIEGNLESVGIEGIASLSQGLGYYSINISAAFKNPPLTDLFLYSSNKHRYCGVFFCEFFFCDESQLQPS